MNINFQDFTHTMGLLHFPALWKIYGETHHMACMCHAFPICLSIYTIGWESNRKKHHRYGESMSINFPDFPHTIGFVVFSRNLWEIYGETHIHAFRALMLNPYMALVNFFLCVMIITENLLATFSIKMIHKKCI